MASGMSSRVAPPGDCGPGLVPGPSAWAEGRPGRAPAGAPRRGPDVPGLEAPGFHRWPEAAEAGRPEFPPERAPGAPPEEVRPEPRVPRGRPGPLGRPVSLEYLRSGPFDRGSSAPAARELPLHRDPDAAEPRPSRGAESRGRSARGAELRGAELRGAELRNPPERGALSSEAPSRAAREAPLRGAPDQGADVRCASVRGPPVLGPPVRGPPERGASAREAPLRGAPDRGADVRGAPVRGAPVRGAPVRGAPVRGAPVRGADVRGAPVPVRGAPVRGPPSRSEGRDRPGVPSRGLPAISERPWPSARVSGRPRQLFPGPERGARAGVAGRPPWRRSVAPPEAPPDRGVRDDDPAGRPRPARALFPASSRSPATVFLQAGLTATVPHNPCGSKTSYT